MGVTVRALVVSRFALDGGAMQGIVPRVLWQRVVEAAWTAPWKRGPELVTGPLSGLQGADGPREGV